MNKIRINLALLLLSTLFICSPLRSQTERESPSQDSLHGFSLAEWDRVNQRWYRFRPAIVLTTQTGESISGQLIAITTDTLTIYRGDSLPFPDIIDGRTEAIAVSGIQAIHFTRGGPKYAGFLTGLITGGSGGIVAGMFIAGGWSMIPPIVLGAGLGIGGAFIGKRIQKSVRTSDFTTGKGAAGKEKFISTIGRQAVLHDGYVADGSLDNFARNSRSVRRAFPDKHLRISIGLSVGPNTQQGNLEKVLAATPLPPIIEYRPSPLALEFYDISWRFSDRFIAGGQLSLNLDSYSYLYGYNDQGDVYYANENQNFEGRIYFEYSPWPVTRSFTKKQELLFGGGAIFGSPSSTFYYSYVPDAVTGNMEMLNYYQDTPIYGLQLRSAFHYYLFPGCSVSAGVEGNLLLPMTVQSFQLPTSDPLLNITIPDYKLNFSTVRFKIGTSLYF